MEKPMELRKYLCVSGTIAELLFFGAALLGAIPPIESVTGGPPLEFNPALPAICFIVSKVLAVSIRKEHFLVSAAQMALFAAFLYGMAQRLQI